MDFDVFNGDADGLCALVQLRLSDPRNAKLVTGVKRDIQLLQRVDAQVGDRVTVLDVSMAKNMTALHQVLSTGASVFYVDHHQSGEIPDAPGLQALINTDANVCTSLLVDQYLQGAYRAWAVTAAFGDNLHASAKTAAKDLKLSLEQLNQLELLGTCLNYNGYGSNEDDLLIHPADLFHELAPFSSPFDFLQENSRVFESLQSGYQEDMAKSQTMTPIFQTPDAAVFLMPDEIWCRRVSGVFANNLANVHPQRAHAIATVNPDGTLTVSVRAPLNNKVGADELCQSFPTGGGRKAAAGINRLPMSELNTFIDQFSARYAASKA